MYPPLAFVIAEQEDMPDRGPMLSLQNLNIFFLIILKSCGGPGEGEAYRRGRCRGSGCLLVGAGTKCKINQGLCYVKGERRS